MVCRACMCRLTSDALYVRRARSACAPGSAPAGTARASGRATTAAAVAAERQALLLLRRKCIVAPGRAESTERTNPPYHFDKDLRGGRDRRERFLRTRRSRNHWPIPDASLSGHAHIRVMTHHNHNPAVILQFPSMGTARSRRRWGSGGVDDLAGGGVVGLAVGQAQRVVRTEERLGDLVTGEMLTA